MLKTLFQTIALCIAIGACASGGEYQSKPGLDTADPRIGEAVNQICFISGINNFSKATDQSVVVSRGARDYLIVTENRCRDLPHAMSLGVDAFSGCLARGDKLIGYDSAFAGAPMPPPFPCLIDEIYNWHPDRSKPHGDDNGNVSETGR